MDIKLTAIMAWHAHRVAIQQLQSNCMLVAFTYLLIVTLKDARATSRSHMEGG